MDKHKPSVTLKWVPPANAADVGGITKYQIYFCDEETGCCHEKVVRGSVTTTEITRGSGLRPLTTFTFNVRAYSRGDYASQESRTVSRFIGMQTWLTCTPCVSSTMDAFEESSDMRLTCKCIA